MAEQLTRLRAVEYLFCDSKLPFSSSSLCGETSFFSISGGFCSYCAFAVHRPECEFIKVEVYSRDGQDNFSQYSAGSSHANVTQTLANYIALSNFSRFNLLGISSDAPRALFKPSLPPAPGGPPALPPQPAPPPTPPTPPAAPLLITPTPSRAESVSYFWSEPRASNPRLLEATSNPRLLEATKHPTTSPNPLYQQAWHFGGLDVEQHRAAPLCAEKEE